MPGLEVWFQRASDVVRKLMYGDVDIGIVGYDMFAEIADGDTGLIVLHDALAFGRCLTGAQHVPLLLICIQCSVYDL